MANVCKLLADPAADALRWGVWRDEMRMLLLQAQELAHQIVELGVADLRLVGDVVELFVTTNETTKFSDA